jgi:hypothetical protein
MWVQLDLTVQLAHYQIGESRPPPCTVQVAWITLRRRLAAGGVSSPDIWASEVLNRQGAGNLEPISVVFSSFYRSSLPHVFLAGAELARYG